MKPRTIRQLTNLIQHPEQLFLKLAKFYSSHPIQVILFICVCCLSWSPHRVAADLADLTVNEVLGRLETEWAGKLNLTPAQLTGRLAMLWAALDQPANRGIGSENQSSRDKAAQAVSLGQTRLREHLPATEEGIRQMADDLTTLFLSVRIPWGSNAMPDTIRDVFNVEIWAFIKRRTGKLEVTESLAAQTWAAITRDFREYDPDSGRFIGWALSKARTALTTNIRQTKRTNSRLVPLDATDQLSLQTANWPRQWASSARPEISLEYLHHFVRRPYPVHKMITDILATMLEYEPLETVCKFRSQTLGAILDRAEEDIVLSYDLPDDEVRECIDTLRQRLKLNVAQAAKGLHLSNLPSGLGHKIAATTPLGDFFTPSDVDEHAGSDLQHQQANQVSDWNAEIRRNLALDVARAPHSKFAQWFRQLLPNVRRRLIGL